MRLSARGPVSHPPLGSTTHCLREARSGVCRALAWVCFGLFLASASAEIARVSSKFLQVGVDLSSGQLVELADTASGQNLVGAAPGGGGLWQLELSGAVPTGLVPTNARACNVEQMGGSEPALRMTWSEFGLVDAPNLRVAVTVRLAGRQASSRWTIDVEQSGGRTPSRIQFPRVLNLAHLENERLVVPFWAGLLAPHPRRLFAANGRGVRREYEYPGHCSMQSMAFYGDGGPGLHLACDDVAGYHKVFAVFSEREAGLNMEVVHLPDPGASRADRYALPYAAVLGTFHGDWFDAATVYRAWATNQVWAQESRRKRGAVPSWVSDTGLWVWNRGRSTNVIEPAVVLQRELGLPVSVFWHWWHGCAYDTGFPEYLPPREGDQVFTTALRQAHESDVHALVYMNQRLWGMTTTSWTNESAETYAVKGSDGHVRPEVYNRFTKLPCATMCMGTDFWRAKYAGVATQAFNGLGVDGIYMDQACSSMACLYARHGHPLGGGTYWMDGFKKLAAGIREQCATRGTIALAGEGCAENWLPYLDVMLALDVSRERYVAPDGWEPIPYFQAVYHEYGVFYGSYSSLTMPPYDDLWPAQFAPKEPLKLLDRKFSRQFCLEHARSFAWGQQPTIANYLPSLSRERPEEIAYVVRLARLRRLAARYLQDGAMLPLPKVGTPSESIPMSRLSIYAGQQEDVKEFQKVVPLVLASAWRAPDGVVAIAVTSISDRSLTPTVALELATYGLPEHGWVYELTDKGAVRVREFSGRELVLTPEFAPRDAKVFELRRE